MSRYQVDKVLWEVQLDEDATRAFRENPAAYVEGRELTAKEREALVKLDYRKLYALGAHPFLLYVFTMAVWPGDRRTAEAEYRAGISALGYPDFAT